MKKHLLTFLALTLFGAAGAQTTHFSQAVGGSTSTSGMGSVRLATGSFITVSTNANNEIELMRYSSNGVVQSTHKLTNPQYSFTSVASVEPAGTNAILVTGQAYNNTAAVTLFYVAKIELSSHTMTLAFKNIDYFSYTKGPKAFYSPEGSIYALFPQYDYFDIHKMDQSLNSLWAKTVECDTVTGKNPGMDCEVVDSSIIVVGKCDSLLGWGDVDTSGSLDSFKLFMINGYTRIYSITKTDDGHLLLAGLYSPVYASGSDSRPLLAKVTRSGNMVWARVLDIGMANTFARFVDARELPNGKIVAFATTTEAYNDTYFDGACVFDGTGNLVSSIRFGTYNWSTGGGIAYQLYDVKVYASGILMTGNMIDYDNGAVIKRMMIFTDENFTEVCDRWELGVIATPFDMGTVHNYESSDVKEGPGYAPTVLAAGTLSPTGSFPADVCAISLGVEDEHAVSANVYPNPVNQGAVLNVEMENPSVYAFVITDLAGKVLVVQNSVGNKGSITTSGLASGVYLLNVMSHNRTVAVEKVLIR